MNETIKNIMERRSIRQFQQTPIKEEDLKIIIDAAKYAPSAVNQQSWHFTVVQNKDKLNKINEVTKEVFLKSGNKMFEERAKAENFSPFYNAPLFIIVSGDKNAVAPVCDGSLALGNMFVAAKALGIASCWIHAMNTVLTAPEGLDLRKELGIPDDYILIGSGAFGYSAVPYPAPAPRRESTVNII